MFTGLIESIGEIQSIREGGGFRQICVALPRDLGVEAVSQGSSIAVNGVCITAREVTEGEFLADLSYETLARTTLGSLGAGTRVNLERALRADSRLGGHIVQGHVDCVGEILAFERDGDDWNLMIGFDPVNRGSLVHKGSIAVDGISLTVARLGEDRFSSAIIPFTLEHTTLQYSKPGDPVNLEFDVLAKYVERLLEPYLQKIGEASS